MEQKKVDRINELARIKKERPLTEEEAAEQKALREEYLKGFRANFEAQLQNTYLQRPDGTLEKLKRKED